MMKNIFSICCCLLIINVYGQQKEDRKFIPEKGFAGATMNVSGLINTIQLSAANDGIGNPLILGKYYVTDQHVVRTGFGISTTRHKVNRTDSVGSAQRNYDSTFSKAAVFIAPGYEYHFLDDKRLDPYIGGTLNLGLIGKSKYNTKSDITDTTGVDKTEKTFQQDGGFVFGATAIAGFNYYIARNFALGAEYQLSFYNERTGGDWERVITHTPISGITSNIRQIGSDRSSVTTLGIQGTLNITLTYFFDLKKKSGT